MNDSDRYLTPSDRRLLNSLRSGISGGGPSATYADKSVQTTVETGRLSTSELNASYVGRGEVVIKAARHGWGVNKTAAQNDAALTAAFNEAADAMKSLSVRSVVVDVGRGRFLTGKISVPGGVSLYGEDRESTELVNTATDGGVYLNVKGSRSRIRGLTVDGQRAAQATTGLAAVQFSRPNAAGARAGGVTLSANVAASATTINITDATPGGEPIRPGESIKLVEGAAESVVRVARTYTVGNLAIPLEWPIEAAFTTAATVSVAASDVDISDSLVYSNGRDAVAMWHVIDGFGDRLILRDFEDTGFDLPSAGSRNVKFRNSSVETKGRWGVAFDTAETAFGRVADCESINNTIRFLPGGGAFVSGGATDGIYFGISDRCKSINDTIDIRLAGISGMRLAGTPASYGRDAQVVNPTVIGPSTPRSGTSGVRSTAGAAPTTLRVLGGDISGAARGIDADTLRRLLVDGTTIRNFTDYGVNVTADTSNPQLASVIGAYTEGGVAGVRFGGAAAAGNKAVTHGCVAVGFSFAAIVADTGWTHVGTGNIP